MIMCRVLVVVVNTSRTAHNVRERHVTAGILLDILFSTGICCSCCQTGQRTWKHGSTNDSSRFGRQRRINALCSNTGFETTQSDGVRAGQSSGYPWMTIGEQLVPNLHRNRIPSVAIVQSFSKRCGHKIWL